MLSITRNPRRVEWGIICLPQQNFNAWFGNTSFSQKWVGALNGKLIEKKVLDGVCKYRMLLSIQNRTRPGIDIHGCPVFLFLIADCAQ